MRRTPRLQLTGTFPALLIGASSWQNRDTAQESDRLVGLAGLLLLALITAVEAFLAGRRARMD
ncbi:MAG: hypothetical protein NT158_03885 [Cyanobacteria bacterium]|nr:hypothetical protein [Cyanobacteriota bacterium]